MGVQKEIFRILSYAGHTGQPPISHLACVDCGLYEASLNASTGWNRQSVPHLRDIFSQRIASHILVRIALLSL